MVKYTGRGLVVKRPGVLSKVQMLNLVLGVGVFSLLPIKSAQFCRGSLKIAAATAENHAILVHSGFMSFFSLLFVLCSSDRAETVRFRGELPGGESTESS